uniref:Uncharacterized protein n=1 Tax=viral metagenome TaxID=1070528 RepID=A0A6C0DRQ2_9ZZZZ
MEIIDIGLNDLEPLNLHLSSDGEPSTKSVNFGPGIELLMNDKAKASSSQNINVDLGDLDRLENELNDLSGKSSDGSHGETKTLNGFTNNLFNMAGFTDVKQNAATNEFINDSKLGSATAESIGNAKTWDGFTKLNEIPLNTERSSANMTDREKRRKKRMMIKKLEEWYSKGAIKTSSHLSMESAYEEVEDEYETVMDDKRKKDSIKLQKWWFMTFVNSIEYANAAFNPFDVNLDGWGEQVNEDIDSYEEIFSELHEKYKGGKLAPEISLLLRLGFSASVVHFTNKALSSSVPGFNDVIRQSPELMRAFTNATVSSMSQQSPGFAFANNLMQDHNNKPRGPPPPAPVETKNMPAPNRGPSMVYTEAPGNRQDINAARGAMFQEQGVNIQSQYQSANEQPRSLRPPQQSNNVQNEMFSQPQRQQQQQQQQPTSHRPEMRGPQTTDIDNILSNLKVRNVDIHNQPASVEDDSMISIGSLKDMQNPNMPKRSRRKQRSDKNVVSLDI